MSDAAVFLVVLGLRLFVPLLILRFPLPAIVAALVLDAADQSIFQALTDLDLTDYQSYDKALDIYYLAIAYISTFRNWRNAIAVATGMFLWYYRLMGVTLFELTGWRPLLLIFPNTFEYYFIAISIIRLRWNDQSLTRRTVFGIAAGIWVFIKLPQEWWIHIAQLDVTDFVKEDLLGVDPTTSYADGFSNRPLVGIAILAIIAILVTVVVLLWRRAPEPDYPLTFYEEFAFDNRTAEARVTWRWRDGLLEKVALLTLVLVTFGQALQSTATILEEFLAASVFVIAMALVTQWRRDRRGEGWGSAGRAFLGNLAVNTLLLVALALVLPPDESSGVVGAAFFLFLMSMLVALFDRYYPTRQPLPWETRSAVKA